MKLSELYHLFDDWTVVNIYDISKEESLYDGLLIFLQTGEKEEDCENILYNSEYAEILEKIVTQITSVGKDKVKINVM
mgnify:FL=1